MPDFGFPDLGDLPQDLVDGLNPQVDVSAVAVRPQAGSMMIPSMRGGGSALAAIAGAIIASVGIDALPAVAVALGYDAATLLKAWVSKKKRGRRRRGVTGRQLTNARRVIRVVEGMHRNLQHAFGRAASHSTSHSGGHRRGRK